MFLDETISNEREKHKMEIYPSKRNRFLKYIYLFLLSLLIPICVLLYIFNISFDTKLGVLGTVIGLIAMSITIHIAKIQDKQLGVLEAIGIKTNGTTEKLEKIGKQTKETTETLHTNSAIQKNREKFFRKEKNENYTLIFPVDHEGKTLPLINSADSYAMHVISNHLGVNDLDFKPISRNTNEDFWKSGDLKCNAILMCDVNPALKQLFKFNEIGNKETSNTDNLPCWFEECKTVDSYCNGKTIRIVIHDERINLHQKLDSPSEECCVEASSPKYENKEYRPQNEIQSDYGILARISKDDYKYIIIAGIHGYGTWITASFLNNLLRGTYQDEIYKKVFFGDNDFIAVIYGLFDTKKLYVSNENIGVHQKYCWKREASEWKQVL